MYQVCWIFEMRDGSGAEPEPAPAAALLTKGLRDPETALRPNT